MTSRPGSNRISTPWPGARACALGLLFILLVIPAVSWAAPGNGDQYDLLARATQLVQEDRLDEAVDVFRKVPPPPPGEDAGIFVRSRMEAAKILLSNKDYQASAAMCHEILSLLPDNLEAKNLLSKIQAAQTPKWVRFLKDMKTYLPTLAKATVMTLLLVLITMFISPVGGLFIAMGRISRLQVLSGLFWCYIWIFRGTPLLLQLFFIYYGLPSLGITLDPFPAAVLGLGLNYSAYLAEIMRGAIESIDAGQMEAAKSLGMSYWQAMRRIIIPQTYKRLVPPVGNEFIALIKDTALVSTIAMVELMRAANQIYSATFNVFILFQAALVYLVLTSIFTVSFRKLEDRLGVYENR
ncbi:MAG TPA: amino acid ABC transporter permease [Deltaproteobacteria bacterium]|nr:amino acid ABC transporter permease [Deltaproteobacteria bacterium]HPR54403.1 amino acid ABC transporter permease [Deltaproteobacteria bacterium]HXK46268.1 amino acid ABC transporter permease [Deltaproteobacteria bacterium]